MSEDKIDCVTSQTKIVLLSITAKEKQYAWEQYIAVE